MQQPELTREQRLDMSAAWLRENQGDLVACRQTPDGKIREKHCNDRLKGGHYWILKTTMLNRDGSKQYCISPRYMACQGCPRFDPGPRPTNRIRAKKPKWDGVI